jgi:hypothetical protein
MSADARREAHEWRNEMTTTTFRPPLYAGVPRLGPTAKRRVADATDGPPPIVRPVALDRGNVLRIRSGRGTRVRVASGVLWVTEEDSPEDHVVLPGDAIDLAQTGTAIVLAHRVSRVVVEVPAGVTPPRAVEMAVADGEPGMRIALVDPTPMSLSTMVTGVATVIGNALASIREMVTTPRSRWDTADASTAKAYGQSHISTALRPGTRGVRFTHGLPEVERAIIDEWMLGRM